MRFAQHLPAQSDIIPKCQLAAIEPGVQSGWPVPCLERRSCQSCGCYAIVASPSLSACLVDEPKISGAECVLPGTACCAERADNLSSNLRVLPSEAVQIGYT